MNYEVELKFGLPEAERPRVLAALAERSLVWQPSVEQEDAYWGHPSRDFSETDEALRIRREGPRAIVTYKGPKIDPLSKTRREIELELPEGADGAARLGEIFSALGFVDFARVSKRRTPGELSYQGREVEASIDEVAGLGVFVELETLATAADRMAAQAVLSELAAEVGLRGSIRRSYLEMLLDRDAAAP